MGIFLNTHLTAAWKRGGQQWQAVSSHVVTARLLVGAAGERLPHGGKRQSDFFLSVVSVYAPTSKATYTVKSQFMADLERAIEQVASNDVLLVLGDFSARVGSPGSVAPLKILKNPVFSKHS